MKVKILSPIVVNPRFNTINVSVEATVQEAVPEQRDPETLEIISEAIPEEKQTLSYSVTKQEVIDKKSENPGWAIKKCLLEVLKEKFTADLTTIDQYWVVKELENTEYEVNVGI